MNVKREGMLIVCDWTEANKGDPQLHHDEGRRRFLAWVQQDESRWHTWQRFAELYEASEDEAIPLATGLAVGDGW